MGSRLEDIGAGDLTGVVNEPGWSRAPGGAPGASQDRPITRVAAKQLAGRALVRRGLLRVHTSTLCDLPCDTPYLSAIVPYICQGNFPGLVSSIRKTSVQMR